VALSAAQFGAVVILGKLVTSSGLPVPSFLGIRFCLAALLLALLLVGLRQPLAAARGERRGLVALGMIGYAVESSCFFLAIRHGGAAAVTLLFFTYPVLVTVIAIATGRGRPTPATLGALACSVAGAVLVIMASGGLDITTLGIAFAFAAALTYSLYLTGLDAVLKRTNTLTGALWVSASAGTALLALASLTGQFALPSGAHQWWQVVGTAAFTAGAFGCLFAGLRRLGPVRTAIVSASEPLAAAVLAVIFLGEVLRPGTVLGGLLILAGAVAASLARGASPGEAPIP
jgi:drug/metabolite transporter (DMT)-like permease